jgi:group I intron endonuclease
MHIYKWTHIKTNRSYIGQSIQLPNQRRLEHLSSSKHTTRTYHFHNALKKYGVEEFSREVIAYANSLDELNQLEEYFIKEYNSIENGFNIRNGGKNKTHSNESKKRMSESQKNAHKRRKVLGINTFVRTKSPKGWKWSDEQKEKLKPVQEKLKKMLKNKTWKIVDGKRVWMEKE